MNAIQSKTISAPTTDVLDCRPGCGACCIAPSITSAIPDMPLGKPAGMRCVQLTDDNACAIFEQPGRPEICRRLRPSPSMCGADRDQALLLLGVLELATRPD